jgi:hypothetical protein
VLNAIAGSAGLFRLKMRRILSGGKCRCGAPNLGGCRLFFRWRQAQFGQLLPFGRLPQKFAPLAMKAWRLAPVQPATAAIILESMAYDWTRLSSGRMTVRRRGHTAAHGRCWANRAPKGLRPGWDLARRSPLLCARGVTLSPLSREDLSFSNRMESVAKRVTVARARGWQVTTLFGPPIVRMSQTAWFRLRYPRRAPKSV